MVEERGLFAAHGVDADVQLVSTNTEIIEAMQRGQTAAAPNTESFMADAEREGWGRILG